MWIDIAVYTLPLGYFAWQMIVRRHKLAYALAAFYVYPLLVFTAVSNEGSLPGATLDEGVVNILRAVWHPAVFIVLVAALLFTRARMVGTPALLAAHVTVCLMLVSALVNQADATASARVVMNGAMVANTLVLIPSLAAPKRDAFIEASARCAIALALFFGLLSVYSIARYGFWPIWSPRLGRPLNANLLAYLITLAIGASFLIRTPEWIRIALVLLVLFPASRLNIATGLLIYGGATTFLMRSAGRIIVRTTLLLCVALAVGAVYVSKVEELATTISPFARSDATSGRTGLWSQALTKIEDAPLLGSGDRVLLENTVSDQEETIRAHDFMLETAMSYGVPAAATAMAVYIVLAFFSLQNTRGGSKRQRRHRAGAAAIIATVIPNTLFATVAWTNLADGSAVLLFLMLAPLALPPTIPLAKSSPSRARFGKTSATVVADAQT